MRLIAIALLLLLSVAGVAAHEGEHICTEVSSGAEYGAHIVEHAKEGHFNGASNPGIHHRGYSHCVAPE